MAEEPRGSEIQRAPSRNRPWSQAIATPRARISRSASETEGRRHGIVPGSGPFSVTISSISRSRSMSEQPPEGAGETEGWASSLVLVLVLVLIVVVLAGVGVERVARAEEEVAQP